jgi:hypothetical protein
MGSAETAAPATVSGDRALMLEEALIFELAAPGGMRGRFRRAG